MASKFGKSLGVGVCSLYCTTPFLSITNAARALTETADPAARVRILFRAATGRRPAPAEARVLLDLAQRRLEHYRKNPAQAAKLIVVGASPAAKLDAPQLAAWTVVASTILNLDETITKE